MGYRWRGREKKVVESWKRVGERRGKGFGVERKGVGGRSGCGGGRSRVRKRGGRGEV